MDLNLLLVMAAHQLSRTSSLTLACYVIRLFRLSIHVRDRGSPLTGSTFGTCEAKAFICDCYLVHPCMSVVVHTAAHYTYAAGRRANIQID